MYLYLDTPRISFSLLSHPKTLLPLLGNQIDPSPAVGSSNDLWLACGWVHGWVVISSFSFVFFQIICYFPQKREEIVILVLGRNQFFREKEGKKK